MQLTALLVSLVLGAAGASAAATTTFPAAAGATTLSAAQTISGTFDGGMKRFGRGGMFPVSGLAGGIYLLTWRVVSCTGQAEGGDKDAVFILLAGAVLKNVIIGKDQIEGIHCKGSCKRIPPTPTPVT